DDIRRAWARGPVGDPDRAGAVKAGQVLEVLLGQMRITIHPVHDLHGEVMVVGAVPNPVDEVGRFLRKPGAEEGRDAVGGIAQPAIAIVPVAIAARVFGGRRGRRRAERAGGRVGQQFDDERGATDGVLEGPGIETLVEPPLPELAGAGRQLRRIAAARKLAAKREVALAKPKREPLLATGLQRKSVDEPWPPIHFFDRALHRHRRGEDHLLRSSGGDYDTLPFGEAGASAAVGRRRVEHALDLNRPASGFDAAADALKGKETLTLV